MKRNLSYAARAIRRHLKANHLSQREFAERVGVSTPLVSHWCNDTTPLSLDTAPRVAREIGEPVAKLLPQIAALFSAHSSNEPALAGVAQP